ncbi:MAG: FliG C-terminal domain-containing protein [Candidatus Latescibacterota bacterium]
MAKTLPLRPNLEQLKKQAKDLQKEYKSGDAKAYERIRLHLPRLAEKSDEEMPKERFVLQDAQHVIARLYGFSSWDMLSSAVKTPFAALVDFTDREIQVLLREVDQRDLVIALSSADEAVCDKILNHNMSERVRQFIKDEIDFVGDLPLEQVDETQFRIVKQCVQLGEKGRVVWPPKPLHKRTAKEKEAEKPSKTEREENEMLLHLAQKKLDELSYDELHQLFVGMAERARKEGILSLESVGDAAVDPFVKMAIDLVVDGTEPALIMDILETWTKSLMHEHERRYQDLLHENGVKYTKVIEAMMAMQAGDNPRVIEHKLSVIY